MTSTAISAQGTTLQIQTTAGAAKAISAVQVGYPTLFTFAAGLANGDVIVLSGFTGADATLLNGQTVIANHVVGTSFAVDINTIGKTIIGSAATATPGNWQTIGNMHTVSGFDGKPTEIDVTNLLSVAKERLVGLVDYGNLSIEVDQLNADLGQNKVFQAYQSGNVKNFKLVLPNGDTATFSAFVNQFSSSLGVDQAVKRTIGLTITGTVVWS